MDGDKSNNWGYQPASTPVPHQNDEFPFMNIAYDESTGVLNNTRSAGSTNQGFFPPNPTPNTPFPRRPTLGAYHPNPYAPSGTSNNLTVDLNQPPNYMNITGNVPIIYPQHHPLSVCASRVGGVDYGMNVSNQFSSFQNPGFGRDSTMFRCKAREIIDLTQEDEDSDFGSTHGPHVRNTREPGPAQHTGGTRSHSQDQLHSTQFGNMRRVDGNFLPLGNELKSNDVPMFDVANRAMGGDQMNVSPSLNVSHPQVKNHVDTGPNRGGFPGFQNTGMSTSNYVGGLSTYMSNDASMSSSNNLWSSNNNLGFPKSSNNNLSFIPNPDSRYGNTNVSHPQVKNHVDTDPNCGGFSGFQYGMSTKSYDGGLSTYMNSSNNLWNSIPSHNVQAPLTNREHGFPNSSNNNQYASLRDFPPESARPPGNISAGFHHPAQMGVSNVAPSSVDLACTTALANLDRYQKLSQQLERDNMVGNMSYNRYGGSTSRVYPGQVIPTLRNSVAQAGNESTQLLTRSNQQAGQVIPTSINSGAQAGNESTQFLMRSNQQSGQPISSSEDYMHLQASNMRAVPPPIKRGLSHPDPALARAQRRRMTFPHPSSPHVSSWPQTAPPGSIHISASKSGSSRDPKPSGFNCKLCKRDLAFPPEGPIHNPRVPPGVAVLPCQHTFHDECLQRTTPDDQASNPPCIPCALGEK